MAGHTGDEAAARALLDEDSPLVRSAALGALARLGAVTDDDVVAGLADPDPGARGGACVVAPTLPGPDLRPLLGDGDPSVVEVAAWALGERGPGSVAAVADLAGVATGHEDPLCREAAVAALGAIGDERGLPAILAGLSDKPAVRRRAVIALTPFEGPEVDAAMAAARDDRDWQVRQAAEELGEPG